MEQKQLQTHTTIQSESAPEFSDNADPNQNKGQKTSIGTVTARASKMGQKQQQLDNNNPKQQQERPIVEVNKTNDNINAACNGEVSEDENNVKDINYQSIADRMLRQLEDQYWEVQKADIGYACHNSKKKQQANADMQINGHERQNQQDDQDIPEGYQNLDNDAQISDNSLNSDQEKQQIQKLEFHQQSQENFHRQGKEQQPIEKEIKMVKDHPNPQAPNQLTLQSACHNNIEILQQSESNYQSQLQLIEVGPTPDSVFAVPDSKQQSDIDCDKIKCLAQSLESELGIITPEWAKDPLQFEKRVRELFGSGSQKLKGTSQRR